MIASSTRRQRSRLLATCALAFAAPAFGQAYPDRALQGDTTIVSGTVAIVRTPTKDTITISSPQAIINWNPETSNNPLPTGAIDFLPNGLTSIFQGATVGQDFVVLNRVLPSTNRAISLNGTVTSQVVTGFTFGAGPPIPVYTRGGSVWFYSPGGIIAGPTAVFNVGNLILTANDIDATGGLFSGAGAIRFRGAGGSASSVTVQPGAQINLTNAGSYLAIVAPQVSMGGTATVNGSAAYVAAEQVNMTVNGGFFSIAFLVGTDVANALTHSGTTTGPAGNGTIAMAAMPKNTAITMLVGGTVGYTPAATATVQNGTVVLSAGQDLAFGTIGQTASATAANLNIGSGLFRSQVNAQATNIVAAPSGGAPLTFTSHANLTGLTSAQLRVDAGQSVTVGGNLNLVSTRIGTGGTASVTVNDGALAVAGQTLINTNAVGLDNPPGTGGNATGGQSLLTINGGTVTLGDTLFLTANAAGGGGALLSGNGTGGTAALTLNAGATPTVLTLNGISNQISAIGSAGNGQLPSLNGGNATGGTASLTINSGLMNSTELFLNAFATGGEAGANGLAGNASGGVARLLMTGGRYNTRSLVLNAEERQGTAGIGGTAGATTGTGLAAVDVSGAGVLAVGAAGGNAMSINANAVKASARVGALVGGGNLIAGTARLTATNGGTITTDATGTSGSKPADLVTASVVFADNIAGAPSASQRGGTAIVNADSGTMTLHKLDIRATALDRTFNVATDPAGPSFGGNATLAARNGGNITVLTGEGAVTVSAWATGGNATTPLAGRGGTITVLAEGGTLNLPDGLSADATGRAGTNQPSIGGAISLLTRAGTGPAAGIMTVGAVKLDASGNAPGFAGGQAGTVTLGNTGTAQTMTLASVIADAGAQGGATSGGIAVTGDATSLNITGAATLRTSGTLGVSGVGTNGRFSIGGTLTGTANTIALTHSGVAAAASVTTLTGPAVSLTATNDLLFTGPATINSAAPVLVAGRDLGGVDGAVVSTGNIVLGTARDLTFRLLTAGGRLLGFNGANPPTPFVMIPGFARISDRVQTGAGNIDLRAGTGIAIGTATTGAGGGINLTTVAGSVLFGTVTAATTLNVTAPGTVTGTSATATTGPLNLTGATGITVPTLVSGGTTTLAAANGVITVATNIQSAGNISATGQSIFLRALGSLTANTLTATAGLVDVASVGLLTATTTQASNSITLASTAGNVVFGTATAGTMLTVTSPGTVTGTNGTATGPVAITGAGGITVPTIVAGGTTNLAAANGAISVATNLQSTGVVTANGRSVLLRATGPMTTGALTATAGNLDIVTGGALNTGAANASGATTLTSTNGALSFTTAQSGSTLTLRAGTTINGTSATAGTNATIGGTTGGNVTLTTLQAGGNATVYGNPASATLAVGTATVGGFLEARGGTLIFGNVSAGNDAILSSFNGGLTVGDVTAGDDIFLSVNGSAANPGIISPDSQTGQGSTTINALVAGNILSTGESNDNAASGPATFTGSGPIGNVIRIRASGNVTTGSITSPDRIIAISDLGTLATGSLNASTGIAAMARGAISLGAVGTNGFFTARDSSQYFALVPGYAPTGLLGFSATPNAGSVALTNVNAGFAWVSSGGHITFGSITTTGDVILSNQAVLGTNIGGGIVAAGGSLSMTSANNIAFATATAGTSALVSATLGSVTGTRLSTGNLLTASGPAGVTIATVTTPGQAVLAAANGPVRVATNIAAGGGVTADGQSVFLRATGPLLATRLTAMGGAIDVASSGTLTVTTGRASGNVLLSSNNDVVIDVIESGVSFDPQVLLGGQADIVLAGNNITLGTSVLATRELNVRAGGTAIFNGLARGTTIDVRSTDVAIAPTARVGALGTTTQVSFTNTGTAGTTFVGGSGTSAGYRLSDAELQRVFATNISVSVVPIFIGSGGQSPRSLTPTLAPDLILDTLTLTGGVNLGANGTLRIQTPGKMRVVGNIALNGMTATNRVDLIAGTSIEALPTSSIILRSATGLAGTLGLTTEDVIASSSAALADVAAAANLGAASDRLGANSGAAVDGGYFQAGGIIATVSRGIYVQNSGTATTNANRDYAGRRGFTVGSGGFTVVQATATPVRIAINGRQVSDTTSFGAPTAGGFATGLDLTPLIRFVPFTINTQPTVFSVGTTPLSAAQQQQAAAIFDTASTVNGCAIISAGTCRTTLNDPIRDILTGDFGERKISDLLPILLVQLKEYVTPGDQPLIDEPVTGAGNDDLWSVDDTKAKCDPAKEKCEAPR